MREAYVFISLGLFFLSAAGCASSTANAEPAADASTLDADSASNDTCEARGGRCVLTAAQQGSTGASGCPGGDAFEIFPKAGGGACAPPNASPNYGCCLPFDAGLADAKQVD